MRGPRGSDGSWRHPAGTGSFSPSKRTSSSSSRRRPAPEYRGLDGTLKKAGILALPFGERFMRMVTHLDFGAGDMERLERLLPKILAA